MIGAYQKHKGKNLYYMKVAVKGSEMNYGSTSTANSPIIYIDPATVVPK